MTRLADYLTLELASGRLEGAQARTILLLAHKDRLERERQAVTLEVPTVPKPRGKYKVARLGTL